MLTPSHGPGGSRNCLAHKSLVFILNSVYRGVRDCPALLAYKLDISSIILDTTHL